MAEVIHWHRVADELPDDETTVLIHCPAENEPVWLGYHEDGCWYTADGVAVRVTAWAEMPEGPGEE